MINKHHAMFEYIKQYMPDYLTFNTVVEHSGQTGIENVFSDNMIKRYFGGAMREYTFAIIQVRQYDTGVSEPSINAEEIFDVEEFMRWIDQQQIRKNYPDFGERCRILKIENLQNMPNMAGTDEQGLAKYMFQCKVTYYEAI